MATSDLHVIVGLGASGFSCARFLKEQGCSVAVMDTRTNPPHLAALQQAYPDIPVSLGRFDVSLLNQAELHHSFSQGVALREPAIAQQMQRGVPIIGDIELFARTANVPVIAINSWYQCKKYRDYIGRKVMAEAAGYHVASGW